MYMTDSSLKYLKQDRGIKYILLKVQKTRMMYKYTAKHDTSCSKSIKDIRSDINTILL